MTSLDKLCGVAGPAKAVTTPHGTAEVKRIMSEYALDGKIPGGQTSMSNTASGIWTRNAEPAPAVEISPLHRLESMEGVFEVLKAENGMILTHTQRFDPSKHGYGMNEGPKTRAWICCTPRDLADQIVAVLVDGAMQ
jgi:hypothetical protein